MYYFSQNTLTESYNKITSNPNTYGTEFFYFLLLKHSGISTQHEISLSSEDVKEKIIEATKDFASLFTDERNLNDKHAKNNFINPFSMSNWGNNPSEPLIKWAPARLINNVTGGGKQWKKILIDDGVNPNKVKLKHDYLDFFSNIEQKYSIEALATWLFKFRSFEKTITASELRNVFLTYFNITSEERLHFFTSTPEFQLEFSNEPVQSHEIRLLIGNPPKYDDWLEVSQQNDIEAHTSGDISYIPFSSEQLRTTNKTIQEYKDILDKAEQALLMGPPGTSKSYIANQLSELFDNVKRIQFHPQYSYQDFIGGKIIENGTLKDKKGEFLVYLEQAIQNQDQSYLLIIEEINRANVSQVFGELIQLLDKGEKLSLSFNNQTSEYYIPKKFKIIGTMNTTDRTVGRIDYAIKRRFYQINFRVDSDLLVDKVQLLHNEFSIADFLEKINANLVNNLNNREMVIGHAIFLKKFVYDTVSDKYVWPLNDFTDLFNYVILPIIDDYCNGNFELISSVIGSKLSTQLSDSEFIEAVSEYLVK
ncbi:TPA: AAA family ATPase [Streptococcus suis]|nr:AAA family ATPase [Streptococcus suis]HEL1818793.1 AAA family ATPase [Streptococcus suis]